MDVETHGWLEPPPDPYKMHRGQFGKPRFNDVLQNLDFAHIVQVGWCAFAANGDVLHRQELCVCDAPPCQQRAVDVHGLTDVTLTQRGESLAEVLIQFSLALQRLQHCSGLLVAHSIEYDCGLLLREYERVRVSANEGVQDATLIKGLAKDGVCTMQAAAAQQQGDLSSRSEAQLRSPGFTKYPICLSTACRMYGVQKPVEGDGYHPHKALYDAELAGRLYFAMRGLRYKEPVKRVLRRLRTTPAATVTAPPPAAVTDDLA